MKKMIIIAFAIFSLSFIANFETQACPVDVDEPWSYGGFVDIPMSATCTIRVEYCYRTWFNDPELWFDSVEFIGDCDDYKDAFDDNPNIYFRLATEYIITEVDPWDILPIGSYTPLCPQQSADYWRYGYASCWSNTWEIYFIPDPNNPWGPPIGIGYRKTPCTQEYENICTRILTYCFESVNGHFQIVWTESNSNSGDPNCSENCTFICE